MQLFKRLSWTAAVMSLGLMSACGGGGGGNGGGSGGDPPSGNNPPPPAPTFHAEAGVAQKGPLINGSTVTVQELDSALSPTGRQFSYQISSDLGTFSPTSTFNSQYVDVNATGYYFDEVLGVVSTGPVTLNSYNDLSTDATLNVNLLTTLAYQRVKNLMTNSSLSFAAARAQAENEVLKALHVPLGSYGSFGNLDLKGNDDGDRLLAAVSGLFVNGNHAGALSTLINDFQSDLGADGTLTNPAIEAALAASAGSVDMSVVAANLTSRYASLGVTFDAVDLAQWIDSDGDGLINKFEFRVTDATPGTLFTLPGAVVNELLGQSISASAGQLSVNGTPISGAATIAAGDVVAVSPGVGAFPDGVLNVQLISQNDPVARITFVRGLLSIAVAPGTSSLAKGLSQQFSATATFSDTSTADLTQQVVWSSSDPAVATINASGLARSFALGSTTITATSGAIAGSETLNVTAARLESFAIAPTSVRSGVGLTAQLSATGTYSDATTANITSQVSWQSQDPAIATINAQTGLATGVATGTTTLEATIDSQTRSASIAIVSNEFSAGPATPVQFSGHTATALANGKVVAFGSAVYNALPYLAIYDPATQTWSQGATENRGGHSRYGHTATLLQSGGILVTGGASAAPPDNDVSIYDPATDRWTSAVASMTGNRLWHSATLLPDGRVLVVGGRDLTVNQTSAELYDPTTNSWSPVASMSVPRSAHTATLLADGKVLVIGGASGPISGWSAPPTQTAEIYDVATNTWSSAGSMAAARSSHTATVLADSRVLVAGGTTDQGAEIYDPASNTWAPAGSLLTARGAHTASLTTQGKVLVVGGESAGGALASSELYDPATNTWSAGPSMLSARQLHTATTLPNNVILIVGGKAAAPLTSTELYW